MFESSHRGLWRNQENLLATCSILVLALDCSCAIAPLRMPLIDAALRTRPYTPVESRVLS